ncbi:unnamed protein product [Rhizophagus irregularis]|uniref:Uncharacterized protein n=1 Tax=Rhizophagus irregularis TaxID=588596 RepID=A0A2I1G1L7_9GLOM|nr:hypothetical protein RhiirA4_415935 [Rhizophagus irregularis]CAB4404971.1 unnamed protein product [Rhizophagus irregularis]CAB4405864.1 unnamed protein product [Rhizophagus irregularis]
MVNLIFFDKAIDIYVESQFGLIVRGLFIFLFGLILLLNTTSNLCVIRQPKKVEEHNLFVKFINICLLPSIYSLHWYEKIKGDDKKDDDKHDHDNCPLCLSHNYVHANLKTFGVKKEENGVNKTFGVKKEENGVNKTPKKDCLVCEKKHSVKKDCCPVCIGHHFIHIQVEKKNEEVEKKNEEVEKKNEEVEKENEEVEKNEKDEKKNEKNRKCCLIINDEDKKYHKEKIYLMINGIVSYLYFLHNFLCAVIFAMISGPSIWWVQLYLIVNSTKFSVYQNSGPDSTYSIIKNFIYDVTHIDLEKGNLNS